jgi:hypothetical protein
MLGIDEHEAFRNAALVDALLHVGRDVDESSPGWDIEPELFAVVFHPTISLVGFCLEETFPWLPATSKIVTYII